MLASFKTHASAFKICVKDTIACLHVAWETQPTNINHKVCLGFIHSIMKQFVSLFKCKWLKPLNTQHLAFYAQVYKHIILVWRPQVLLVILYGVRGSFLSFSMANKYPTITSTLTNVDFRLDAIWSMSSPLVLVLGSGDNGWSVSSRG